MRFGTVPLVGLVIVVGVLLLGPAAAPASSSKGTTLHLTAIVTTAKLSGPVASPGTSTDINLTLQASNKPAGKIGAHCSSPGDFVECRGRAQLTALGGKFHFISVEWTCSTTSPSCASVGTGTIADAGKDLGTVKFKTPPLTKALGGKLHGVPHQFPVVVHLLLE